MTFTSVDWIIAPTCNDEGFEEFCSTENKKEVWKMCLTVSMDSVFCSDEECQEPGIACDSRYVEFKSS
jgi:hypothetical protein